MVQALELYLAIEKVLKSLSLVNLDMPYHNFFIFLSFQKAIAQHLLLMFPLCVNIVSRYWNLFATSILSLLTFILGQSIQLGDVFFSIGDHDLLFISISCLFSASVSPSLIHYVSHPTSFHVVFPCCLFLGSFQLSQDVLVSLFCLVFTYSIYERSCCTSFFILSSCFNLSVFIIFVFLSFRKKFCASVFSSNIN